MNSGILWTPKVQHKHHSFSKMGNLSRIPRPRTRRPPHNNSPKMWN